MLYKIAIKNFDFFFLQMNSKAEEKNHVEISPFSIGDQRLGSGTVRHV